MPFMLNDLKIWIPLGLNLIATIIAIVWFFAKLDKRIDLIKQEMKLKMDELKSDISEIRNNHLIHLNSKMDRIECKLTEHLIKHGGIK
jgi:predicted Holliday junction resolvase-like endonuclease